jgi:hypothetical protein
VHDKTGIPYIKDKVTGLIVSGNGEFKWLGKGL